MVTWLDNQFVIIFIVESVNNYVNYQKEFRNMELSGMIYSYLDLTH